MGTKQSGSADHVDKYSCEDPVEATRALNILQHELSTEREAGHAKQRDAGVQQQAASDFMDKRHRDLDDELQEAQRVMTTLRTELHIEQKKQTTQLEMVESRIQVAESMSQMRLTAVEEAARLSLAESKQQLE